MASDDGSSLPLHIKQPCIGAGVEAQDIEGSGRGLVATRGLRLGELVLVCNPLVSMQGPPGLTPQPTDLTPALVRTVMQLSPTPPSCQETASSNTNKDNVPPASVQPQPPSDCDDLGGVSGLVEASWLECFWQLYGGSQEPSCLPRPLALLTRAPGVQHGQGSHAPLQQLLQHMLHVQLPQAPLQQATNQQAHVGDAAATPGDRSATSLPPSSLEVKPGSTSNSSRRRNGSADMVRHVRQAAARRAQLNAYGEPHQDVVSVALMEPAMQRFRASVGVWPAMALINHACSPNACTMLVDGRMVVRAARDVEPGQEITISYAGTHAGSPVGVRRAALRDGFGFRCDCTRCLIEQDYEQEESGRGAQALHAELVSAIRPALLAALDASDTVTVRRMSERLVKRLTEYQQVLERVPDEDDRAVLACAALPLCLELNALTQHTDMPNTNSNSNHKKTATARTQVTSASVVQRQGKGRMTASPGVFSKSGESAVEMQPSDALMQGMKRLELLRQVAPGSYAEAELSARLLKGSWQQLGASHPVTQAAHAQCLQAHAARYGPTRDPSVLLTMLTAHEDNTLADDMAQAVAAVNSM